VWFAFVLLYLFRDKGLRKALFHRGVRRAAKQSGTVTPLECSSTSPDDALTQQLAQSIAEAASLRVRVSFTMISLGTLLVIYGTVPYVASTFATEYNVVYWEPLDAVGDILNHDHWLPLAPPGALLMLLSMQPTDAHGIRCLCIFSFIWCLCAGALSSIDANSATTVFEIRLSMTNTLSAAWYIAGLLLAPSIFSRWPALHLVRTGGKCHLRISWHYNSPRAALGQLWLVVRLTIWVNAGGWLVHPPLPRSGANV